MDVPVAAGTRYMREVNTTAVLTLLRAADHTSAPELARQAGLSRQAVSRSLSDLREAGLVEFLAPMRSGAGSGRPAQRVRFRAEAGHVLGASVSPEGVRVGLADLSGTISAAHNAPLPGFEERGAKAVARALTDAARRVLAEARIEAGGVWHASIGVPGIVDPATGRVRFAPSMPGVTGDALIRALGTAAGCEVYLDNDVKLATEGELWRGGEHRSMVLIHWGERVGAGIVAAGALHRGATNDAGDLGYLDLFTDAPEPAREEGDAPLGAFEAWTGTGAFAGLIREAARGRGDHALLTRPAEPGAETAAVVSAVLNEVPAALVALEEITRRFAQGVGAVRALLDPGVVVVGGPMARCGPALSAALRTHLSRQRLDPPPLELSRMGEDSVVQGALRHSLDQVERTRLRPPSTTGRPDPVRQTRQPRRTPCPPGPPIHRPSVHESTGP